MFLLLADMYLTEEYFFELLLYIRKVLIGQLLIRRTNQMRVHIPCRSLVSMQRKSDRAQKSKWRSEMSHEDKRFLQLLCSLE